MARTQHTTLHHLVGKRFVGQSPNGSQVIIDGEEDHPAGMRPMQLLLNAWGGCVAYDVVEMLAKRRLTVNSYRIELSGERDDGTPAFYTKLHARHIIDAPGLEEHTFRRFVELATHKYCSVGASLRAEQSFDVELLHAQQTAAQPMAETQSPGQVPAASNQDTAA